MEVFIKITVAEIAKVASIDGVLWKSSSQTETVAERAKVASIVDVLWKSS